MRQNLYTSVLRKEIAWHDEKTNQSGPIGALLGSGVD
jgi:hypothetical protein